MRKHDQEAMKEFNRIEKSKPQKRTSKTATNSKSKQVPKLYFLAQFGGISSINEKNRPKKHIFEVRGYDA